MIRVLLALLLASVSLPIWAQPQSVIPANTVVCNPTSSAAAPSTCSTTGTGSTVVRATSPTLVTPNLGTPSAIDLSNSSNLPATALPDLINANTSGNAATASAFDHTPTGCTTMGTFATSQNANGSFNCETAAGAGSLNPDGSPALNELGYFITGTTIHGLALPSANKSFVLQDTTGAPYFRSPAQVIGDLNSCAANAQTGTTYTLALTDLNCGVTMNNASANTATIPPNSSVAFPIGSVQTVQQLGSGITTVAPGAGVTIQSPRFGSSTSQGYALGGQFGYVQLQKVATDTWNVVAYKPGNTTFSVTGGTCTTSTPTGNNDGGVVTLTSAGNCTVIITIGGGLAAKDFWNGLMCDRDNLAIPCWPESAGDATTITFSIPTSSVSADHLSWGAKQR